MQYFLVFILLKLLAPSFESVSWFFILFALLFDYLRLRFMQNDNLALLLNALSLNSNHSFLVALKKANEKEKDDV